MGREFNDMHPEWPDENKVVCRDCRFRDKTEVFLLGKREEVGITRCNCEKYPGNGENKPVGILFYGDPCPFYEKE